MPQKMHARDAIAAAYAECYTVIDGRRYNFMQAIELSAEAKKTKKKVPILGRPSKGNKSVGVEYTGKCKFHFNTSIFNQMLLDYQDTGKDVYFDIIITNEDPTSTVGRQTVILKDCNIDGGTITAFNADEDTLTDEISFTCEMFKMPESFTMLDGMEL